ncbi:UbiA family prenyltransferase [Lyngbya confervoides]|uniref:UbiA family prenyltransferase n=1 Tax=Lyngbya confervoides BDU141951 TaxID=1574623 RepID=A0ABD4T5Y8_9CYAN|nr:UbiA family prenyltransferase [Lyngbya confervoides]MCM1983999.1 UbiA family prenyltransferase [Lyngbya confervoides BDU141951]
MVLVPVHGDSPWKLAIAYGQLIRWPVPLLAAAGGIVTLYSLDPQISLRALLLTGLVLGTVFSAACAINDVEDLEKDSINHPERPLPSGTLSVQQGRQVAALLFGIAALAALALGMAPAVLVGGTIPCLWFYSQLLAISGILGNILVASIIAALFLFTGLVVGRPWAAAYPALFLFLYQLAKEIIWDIHDVAGDRAAGLVTLASCWGARRAYGLAWMLLGSALLSIPLAVWRLPLRHPLWFGALTTAMLLSFMGSLWRYQQSGSNPDRAYRQFTRWERGGLWLGIAGLWGAVPR